MAGLHEANDRKADEGATGPIRLGKTGGEYNYMNYFTYRQSDEYLIQNADRFAREARYEKHRAEYYESRRKSDAKNLKNSADAERKERKKQRRAAKREKRKQKKRATKENHAAPDLPSVPNAHEPSPQEVVEAMGLQIHGSGKDAEIWYFGTGEEKNEE